MRDEIEQVEKEKKQLLMVMNENPHSPGTQWASSLEWFYSDMRPNQSKVSKRLKQLVEDGLVIHIGHRYIVK